MMDWADDAAALATHLAIDRATVFGHSYGGWVAQELALRHPALVSALVLAATTPGQLGETESPDDEQGPPLPEDLAAILGTPPTSDEAVADTYARLAPWFANNADPALLTDHIDPRLVDAATMRAVFEELSRWSSVDRLDTIACPTLVLAARDDLFCSAQQGERMAKRIPGADLVVLGRAGHFPWLERPADFGVLLSGWLCARGS
jgi:pimeloyl-ACP methyl ester carboxylesterase